MNKYKAGDEIAMYKKIGCTVLSVLLSTVLMVSTVWADNSALVKKAEGFCANATYDIPTVTNEIEGWPQGPAIMCDAAVVMEAETGTVVYDKAMDERRYPASTTKIMTALVALENSELTDTVTFTEQGLREAVPGNSYVTPNLQVGETLTMEQCLYAIMLVSGNEVSTQVAEHIAGSVEAFADLMNQKASELGCKETHFMNANGLHDENHYTTAHDLAIIAKAAFDNEDFRRIVGTKMYSIPPTNMTSQQRDLQNHHALICDGEWYYDGCLGGKTGYTDTALNTLVTYAEKNGMIYIVVVMHYKGIEVFTDTVMLMEYAGQFDKVEVTPKEYTKAGGWAVLPSGTQALDVEVQIQGGEGTAEEQQNLLYHGHPVGTAVVDEASRKADEEKALREQQKQEEEVQKPLEESKEAEKTEDKGVYIVLIGVLGICILLGVIGIIILALKKKKHRKRS